MNSLLNMTEEEIDVTVNNLEKQGLERNRVTTAEFARYEPLFQEDANLDQATTARLSEDFSREFNLQAPVIVCSDAGKTNPVRVVPPQIRKSRLLNEIGSADTVDRVRNILARQHQPGRPSKAVEVNRLSGKLAGMGEEEQSFPVFAEDISPQEEGDQEDLEDFLEWD